LLNQAESRITMRKNNILSIALVAVLFLSFQFQLVSAAGLVPCGGSPRCCAFNETLSPRCVVANPTKSNCEDPCALCHFFELFQRILNYVLALVFIISVVIFVYAGFLFFTAGGNPNAVKESMKIITSAGIGLAIMFSAWLLTNVVFIFIGVADWTGLNGGWFQIDCMRSARF